MTGSRSLPDAWWQLEEHWRSRGFTRWPASPGVLPDPLLERRLYFSLLSDAPLAICTAPEIFRAAAARRDGEGSHVFERMLHLVERPAPRQGLERVVESFAAVGVDLSEHDFRPLASSWRHAELGLVRSGWSGRLDGTEVARVAWLREVAGVVLERPIFELWLWLERLPVAAPRETAGTWSADLDWSELRRREEAEFSTILLATVDEEDGWREESFDVAMAEAERALSMDAPRAAWHSVVRATSLLEWVRRVRPPGATAARASRLAEAVVRCTDAVRRRDPGRAAP